MIHRAVLGSFERFIGIIIEHYGGEMPLWLSPEQMRIMPISEKSNDYARKVEQRLRDEGMRAGCDTTDEKINAKIARAHAEKVPYMLVVGPKESQDSSVNLRIRGIKDTRSIGVEEFVAAAKRKMAAKDMRLAL
jgi:threonyl-tRNA synthetase